MLGIQCYCYVIHLVCSLTHPSRYFEKVCKRLYSNDIVVLFKFNFFLIIKVMCIITENLENREKQGE